MLILRLLVCQCMFIAYMAVSSSVTASPSPELLKRMNSDEFKVRGEAYEELSKWAKANTETSPEELYQAWKTSDQPEVRSRCYGLMEEIVVLRRFGKGRGYIGIRMQQLVVQHPKRVQRRAGVQITAIMPDTPAAKAGLKMNDIVWSADQCRLDRLPVDMRGLKVDRGFGQEAVSIFSAYIQSKKPGDTVSLHILRQGEEIKLDVKLMRRPDELDVDAFGRRADLSRQKKEFFESWLKKMASE